MHTHSAQAHTRIEWNDTYYIDEWHTLAHNMRVHHSRAYTFGVTHHVQLHEPLKRNQILPALHLVCVGSGVFFSLSLSLLIFLPNVSVCVLSKTLYVRRCVFAAYFTSPKNVSVNLLMTIGNIMWDKASAQLTICQTKRETHEIYGNCLKTKDLNHI